MNRDHDQVLRLWAQYLAGEALSKDDQLSLLEVLEHDPGMAKELFSEAETHGFLESWGRVHADGEAFLSSFLEFQANDGDGTRFIRQVESRLREDLPPRDLDPSLKSSEPPVRHLSERHPTPRKAWRKDESQLRGYLVPLLGAAALLFGLLVYLSGGSSPRSLPEMKSPETAQGRSGNVHPTPPEPERRDPVPNEAPRPKVEPSNPPGNPPLEPSPARPGVGKDSPPVQLPDGNPPARRPEPSENPSPPSLPKPQESLPTLTAKPDLVVATVERIQGEVYLIDPKDRRLVTAGQGLRSGQGLETAGGESRLTLVYPDKTRLELGAGTAVTGITERGAAPGGPRGKRLTILQGTLAANVSKQPLDQPMIFATPHGEAKVLGTTLRIAVTPDSKKGTRLEVEEGRVELKNLGGKAAIVTSGTWAVAAAGVECAPAPILLFADTFERGDLAQWHTPLGGKWRIMKDPSGPGLVLGGGPGRGGTGEREKGGLQCGIPAWQDYALEASVRFEGKVAGGVLLMARMRGSDSLYWFEYKVGDTGQAGVYLFKMVNRIGTSLKADPVPAPLVSAGQWFRLRFELEGKRLRGFMNGILMAETEDADLPSGGAGLTLSDAISPATAILWSNIRVENLSLPKR